MLFQLVEEKLAEFGYFGGDDSHAIWLERITREIIAMIIFSGVEFGEGGNLGDDGIVPYLRRLDLSDDLFGGRLLFGRVIKDGGAVLSSDIGALAVEAGRIVNGEEYL